MKPSALFLSLVAVVVLAPVPTAGQPPAQPLPDTKADRIVPGQIRRDVKTTRVRGQLESFDPKTQTGAVRRNADGTHVPFTVLPHAILLHRCTQGGAMSDYRRGQQLAFYLLSDDAGKPAHLLIIQDELNELYAHKECYHVKSVDAAAGVVVCDRASLDRTTKLVWENLRLQTTPDTKYWKAGKSDARIADLKVGGRFYAVTYGGQGLLDRFAADLLLDEETLLQWRDEQVRVQKQRFRDEGIPAYLDAADGKTLRLTVFPTAVDYLTKDRPWKVGDAVRVAATVQGTAEGPKAAARAASLRTMFERGAYVAKLGLTLDADPPDGLKPTAMVRIFPPAP